MLPLIRLKVDTTDVKDMSNPVRFGQEFMGRLANPRDVLVFHRSKKAATRSGKVVTDEPELEDPAEAGLSTSEKLARVRVSNLVKQYLEAQELQLLGEMEMSDAIGMFVEKDDIHAISTYVTKAFKKLTKTAQSSSADADKDIDEEDVEEMLSRAKEQQA
uniref:Double-strand break repair protein mre11 n=1 Tax=Mycena chlorophos TaxID=658473 RepID=A0ABQ0LQS8_MYCCL|nr:double-strand break repair protein mre11 [Mycena chlorophos]